MIRSLTSVLVLAVLAACAPKEQEAAPATADSTASPSAFTDSANARDSIGPLRTADSTAGVTLRDSTGSESSVKPAAGAYIGRDSAFGPTFTVDSTGKVTPIAPAKKKP